MIYRAAIGGYTKGFELIDQPFSVEPILAQSAWFRPHNQSEDVPNLYFAGAGTYPGAGIPGVISSGKIVADMIGKASVSKIVKQVIDREAFISDD